MSQKNCDSTIVVNLVFNPYGYIEINYQGCEGDGYSVVVNGTIYNESNPDGTDTLLSAIGCDSIIQVSLLFEDCNEQDLDCVLYIPNVISPNDDGINDAFSFGYGESCDIMRFRIAIFDRWGEELYYSEDPSFKWNGDFKGKQLPPGVFVYVAEIYFNSSLPPLIRRGDVTLIR